MYITKTHHKTLPKKLNQKRKKKEKSIPNQGKLKNKTKKPKKIIKK